MSLKSFMEGEMRRARRRLAGPAAPGEAVHETRKGIKKLRAGLRLGRKAFGREATRKVDIPLRAAGRALGPLRDRRVLGQTVGLLRKGREPVPRLPRPSPAERSRIAEARRDLERADVLLRELPWEKAHADALAAGLRRLYRRGRKAMREARRKPSDETLHAWRKRTKDLLYALPVAAAAVPRRLPEATDRLARLLGDDHDLAFFAASALGREKKAGPLARRAGRKRRKLQEQAFRTGSRVYRRRPRAAVGGPG